jgi:hypothetical protein
MRELQSVAFSRDTRGRNSSGSHNTVEHSARELSENAFLALAP